MVLKCAYVINILFDQILLEKFPDKLFDALSLAVQKHLEESNKARAAGNTDW